MILRHPRCASVLGRGRAFTLVELLVAMVITGIIGSMVAVALQGARKQAQETRAHAFVDRLNLVMLQLYEEESTRRIGVPSPVWTGESVSQTQLMWKRDWLRAALPDSKTDIDAGSGRSGAPPVYPVTSLQGDGTRNQLDGPPPAGQRHTMSARYRNRIIRTYEVSTGSGPGTLTWTDAYNAWTDQHESAECLYQIFANNTLHGKPLLDQLRTRDVEDTDEDGMPEIIDPWGTPVLWMRSPAGFYLKNRWVDDETVSNRWLTVGEMRAIVAKLGPDPVDILRSDPRHTLVDDNAAGDLIDPTQPNPTIEADKIPFFVRPLVISAGLDREFDVLTVMPGAGRETSADDAITTLSAPTRFNVVTGVNQSHPTGYPTPVYFPDPYYTLTIVDASNNFVDGPRPLVQRLGAVTDVDSDQIDDSADNIYPSLGL